MDRAELQELAYLYGGDLTLWPDHDAERARALCMTDPSAAELLREIARYDEVRDEALDAALIAALPAPSPSPRLISNSLNDFNRVLAERAAQSQNAVATKALASSRSQSILDRAMEWLQTATSGNMGRAAFAACLALLVAVGLRIGENAPAWTQMSLDDAFAFAFYDDGYDDDPTSGWFI